MTYQGTVSNGVVVFPPEVVLPEGASVDVEVKSAPEAPEGLPESKVEIRNGFPVFVRSVPGADADKDSPHEAAEQTATEGAYVFEMKNGVPLLPVNKDFKGKVTMELVNRLRDELP